MVIKQRGSVCPGNVLTSQLTISSQDRELGMAMFCLGYSHLYLLTPWVLLYTIFFKNLMYLCTTLLSGGLQIFYAWTRSPEVIEV